MYLSCNLLRLLRVYAIVGIIVLEKVNVVWRKHSTHSDLPYAFTGFIDIYLVRLLYEIPESFPWERKLVKMTYLRDFKLIYCSYKSIYHLNSFWIDLTENYIIQQL